MHEHQSVTKINQANQFPSNLEVVLDILVPVSDGRGALPVNKELLGGLNGLVVTVCRGGRGRSGLPAHPVLVLHLPPELLEGLVLAQGARGVPRVLDGHQLALLALAARGLGILLGFVVGAAGRVKMLQFGKI